jgi:hypothetical protein
MLHINDEQLLTHTLEVGPLVGPEVGPEVGPGACLTHASDPMTTCSCRTASTTRRQRSKGESVLGK